MTHDDLIRQSIEGQASPIWGIADLQSSGTAWPILYFALEGHLMRIPAIAIFAVLATATSANATMSSDFSGSSHGGSASANNNAAIIQNGLNALFNALSNMGAETQPEPAPPAPPQRAAPDPFAKLNRELARRQHEQDIALFKRASHIDDCGAIQDLSLKYTCRRKMYELEGRRVSDDFQSMLPIQEVTPTDSSTLSQMERKRDAVCLESPVSAQCQQLTAEAMSAEDGKDHGASTPVDQVYAKPTSYGQGEQKDGDCRGPKDGFGRYCVAEQPEVRTHPVSDGMGGIYYDYSSIAKNDCNFNVLVKLCVEGQACGADWGGRGYLYPSSGRTDLERPKFRYCITK
jgi:hypothetical protein